MPQLTPKAARIIDPVLTAVAQGYHNAEMVAGFLFPRVTVNLRGGSILSFGKEAFRLYSNTQRAPGENTKRVQFGYAGLPFALVDYSLEGQVPVEVEQEAQNGPGIDLSAASVNGVSNIMDLRLEKQAADLARNTANYAASNKVALSGTSQWSDFTGTSNPVKVIETAKEAVRGATGKRPNTVLMGAAVFAQLKQNPVVIDRMKYTGRDVASVELLASLFGVQRVVVGDAVYADDTDAFYDVWGKDVVVAYTDLSGAQDRGTPSYGYTYNLDGYPLVEEEYVDRNAKSWIQPVTRCEAPVIAAPYAGYLISNAVA